MSEEKASYRRIVTSTSIVGGATALTILIGLARTKIIALHIGPAGVGLMGVFISIVATGAAIGGMGLSFSGVRQIAANESTRTAARRALWLATWPLAILSALIMWIARFEIARLVLGSAEHALAVGLTGIGVLLTIVSMTQAGVIQAYRLVGEFARARIYGAIVSLILAVPAVIYFGPLGIVLAVLAVPLGNLLAALPFSPSVDRTKSTGSPALGPQLRQMLSTGLTVMVTSTLAAVMLVMVRAIIVRGAGLDEAGLYQAAYALSAVNISLVLAAMGSDYLPRISALKDDCAASQTLINQQLHTLLLMAAPILIAIFAAAPLLLQLLYSEEFRPAAELLRWQVAGDLLKLPAWALGFFLLARADNMRFLLMESLFATLYVVGTYLLLPAIGLAGVGIAYLAAYGLHSIVVIAVCARSHDIRLSKGNLRYLGMVAALLAALNGLALVSTTAAIVTGIFCALLLAVYGARELGHATGWLSKKAWGGRQKAATDAIWPPEEDRIV